MKPEEVNATASVGCRCPPWRFIPVHVADEVKLGIGKFGRDLVECVDEHVGALAFRYRPDRDNGLAGQSLGCLPAGRARRGPCPSRRSDDSVGNRRDPPG